MNKRRWVVLGIVVAIVIAWWAWPSPRTQPRGPNAPEAAPAPTRPRAKAAPTRATVTGTVRDDAAKPLASARVCVAAADDVQCVATDDRGAYRFVGLAPGDTVLSASRAEHRGHAESIRLVADETRVRDLVLARGGVELAGTVEDILGGPIAGAWVSAEGVAAQADATGRFALWLSPSASMTVTATATGYGPRQMSALVPSTIVIALAPVSTISGRVVDGETGAPVADARVLAMPRGREVVTNADGTFVIDGFAAETVQLSARTAGRYGRSERWLALGVGESLEGVELRVHPAHAVIATVAGPATSCDPTPTLLDWHLELPPPWRDEDGRFHFDGVPPSVYTVQLGCGMRIAPLTVADKDVEVTWRVPEDGVVRGTVARSDGAMLSAPTVELTALASSNPSFSVKARGGAYEYRGIAPGTYTLRALVNIQTTSTPITIEVKAGEPIERALVIEIQDARTHPAMVRAAREPVDITGRVIDARRAPVAGAVIDASSLVDPRSSRILTRDDGTFTVRARASQVAVNVFRLGGGGVSTKIEAGASNVITLAPPRTMRGQVRRGDGSPATRFVVRIGDTARSEAFDHTAGRFSIDVPGTDPVVLSASVNDLPGPAITTAGEDVVLQLPATVHVTGRVIDAGSQRPIVDARIGARETSDGTSFRRWFVHGDQITDAEGRFTLRDVPVGALVIEIKPPSDAWSKQAIPRTVGPTARDLGDIGLARVR